MIDIFKPLEEQGISMNTKSGGFANVQDAPIDDASRYAQAQGKLFCPNKIKLVAPEYDGNIYGKSIKVDKRANSLFSLRDVKGFFAYGLPEKFKFYLNYESIVGSLATDMMTNPTMDPAGDNSYLSSSYYANLDFSVQGEVTYNSTSGMYDTQNVRLHANMDVSNNEYTMCTFDFDGTNTTKLITLNTYQTASDGSYVHPNSRVAKVLYNYGTVAAGAKGRVCIVYTSSEDRFDGIQLYIGGSRVPDFGSYKISNLSYAKLTKAELESDKEYYNFFTGYDSINLSNKTFVFMQKKIDQQPVFSKSDIVKLKNDPSLPIKWYLDTTYGEISSGVTLDDRAYSFDGEKMIDIKRDIGPKTVTVVNSLIINPEFTDSPFPDPWESGSTISVSGNGIRSSKDIYQKNIKLYAGKIYRLRGSFAGAQSRIHISQAITVSGEDQDFSVMFSVPYDIDSYVLFPTNPWYSTILYPVYLEEVVYDANIVPMHDGITEEINDKIPNVSCATYDANEKITGILPVGESWASDKYSISTELFPSFENMSIVENVVVGGVSEERKLIKKDDGSYKWYKAGVLQSNAGMPLPDATQKIVLGKNAILGGDPIDSRKVPFEVHADIITV